LRFRLLAQRAVLPEVPNLHGGPSTCPNENDV